MDTLLVIVTIANILFSIICVGKFFCVTGLEDIYDAMEDGAETKGIMIMFWVFSNIIIILAWVFFYFELEILKNLAIFFGSLFSCAYVIGVPIIVLSVLTPKLRSIHEKLKSRKKMIKKARNCK